MFYSTVMRIVPDKVDFYHAETNLIADRIEYTRKDGIWIQSSPCCLEQLKWHECVCQLVVLLSSFVILVKKTHFVMHLWMHNILFALLCRSPLNIKQFTIHSNIWFCLLLLMRIFIKVKKDNQLQSSWRSNFRLK